MFGMINRGQLGKAIEDEFENFFAKLRQLWLTEHNEDGTHKITPRGFDFVPTGAIMAWSTATAPDGWVLCDGSQLSRVDYKTLFDVIGTTYGVGDGATTFNVPDLRGRFPLGKASVGTGSVLASTGGSLDHTHSGGSVSGSTAGGGDHTHTFSGTTNTTGDGTTNNGDTNGDGTTDTFLVQTMLEAHTHPFGGTTDSDGSHSHGAGTLAVGTSGVANPAYLALNYIILTGRA